MHCYRLLCPEWALTQELLWSEPAAKAEAGRGHDLKLLLMLRWLMLKFPSEFTAQNPGTHQPYVASGIIHCVM